MELFLLTRASPKSCLSLYSCHKRWQSRCNVQWRQPPVVYWPQSLPCTTWRSLTAAPHTWLSAPDSRPLLPKMPLLLSAAAHLCPACGNTASFNVTLICFTLLEYWRILNNEDHLWFTIAELKIKQIKIQVFINVCRYIHWQNRFWWVDSSWPHKQAQNGSVVLAHLGLSWAVDHSCWMVWKSFLFRHSVGQLCKYKLIIDWYCNIVINNIDCKNLI